MTRATSHSRRKKRIARRITSRPRDFGRSDAYAAATCTASWRSSSTSSTAAARAAIAARRWRSRPRAPRTASSPASSRTARIWSCAAARAPCFARRSPNPTARAFERTPSASSQPAAAGACAWWSGARRADDAGADGRLRTFETPRATIAQVAFSPDGARVLAFVDTGFGWGEPGGRARPVRRGPAVRSDLGTEARAVVGGGWSVPRCGSHRRISRRRRGLRRERRRDDARHPQAPRHRGLRVSDCRAPRPRWVRNT